MKTESEIKAASAEEVAKVLTAFNQWRRGEPPYHYGSGLIPCSAEELNLYIDRAVQLLNQKGDQ